MLCDTHNRENFDTKWPRIKPLIVRLLKQENVKKNEWFNLFSDIHTMCLWDEECIPKLKQELESNILDFINSVQDLIKRHEDDEALLRAYILAWSKFLEQSNYLPHPFSSMEPNNNSKTNSSTTSSVIPNPQRKTPESHVRKLMLDTWSNTIFISIKHRLQNSAMKIIYQERIGEPFDSQLVIGVRESYVNLSSDPDDRLSIYKENFEKAYIESLIEFYNKHAQQYITENGIINYLTYADMKLKEEEKRAQKYLETGKGSNSLDLHKQACIDVLVSKYQEQMFAECKNLIQNNDIKNLNFLFQLMDRIPNVEPLLADLEAYIISEGLSVMRANSETITTDSEKYVEQLLELFNRFTKLVEDAFNGDPRFMTSRDKAFKSINKDVFMKYHKAHLTRRLILEISNDQEMEEQTVIMLKDIGMPPEYINKLSQMFKDIKVSEDINDKFKQVARINLQNTNLADIINIKILNAGAWSRSSDKVAVTLPPELEDYIPEVEKFYKNEHSGRKLTWHHLMSNGVINFNTKLGKFELEVTTFQMAVLFSWTNRASDKLSYESLRLATELPDNELRRTLWQLVAYQKLKHQVLCYAPQVKQPKDFDDNTQFWINQDFCIVRNNKAQYRGKLNLIGRLQLSTEKNREEENQEIMFLRAERTKEAIVKILKMRKRVSLAQLQTELIELLKNMFLPSKKLVKETIEWLIEHKYMERDETNINTFVYTT
ncbi:unnamed protein product [Brachionus calyciflorus]|uniref:Cullin-5 n=1 Tax=Brachionus calyciflorus TaxID=104777 RepID=A0A813MFQ8_9BILA|nr:unnamed protein product [Brachionus calyciflorus]